MGRPDLPRARDLPEWMVSLQIGTCTPTPVGLFSTATSTTSFYAMARCGATQFFDAFFDPSGKLVVHYDPGRGIWFPNESHAVQLLVPWSDTILFRKDKVAPRGLTQTSEKTSPQSPGRAWK